MRTCDVTFLVFLPPLSFAKGSPVAVWTTNILGEKRFHVIYIGFVVGLSAYQGLQEKCSHAKIKTSSVK
jgi:hypothetical protein